MGTLPAGFDADPPGGPEKPPPSCLAILGAFVAVLAGGLLLGELLPWEGAGVGIAAGGGAAIVGPMLARRLRHWNGYHPGRRR